MISFELVTSAYSLTETLPICGVVQKRLDYVLYSTQVPRHGTNVEYLGSEQVQARNVLEIYDKSNSLSGNVIVNYDNTVDSATGFNIAVPGKLTLITNEWNYYSDNTVLPLFYRHHFPSAVTTVSVQVTTNTGSYELDPLYWKLNSQSTDLFVNDQNLYNELTGEFKLYYVNWIDGSGEAHVDLCNLERAFHEAVLDDLDPITGLLDTNSYGYVLSQSGSQYYYQMPNSNTYLFKAQDNVNIELLGPTLDLIDDPWFISITNGTFSSTVESTVYNYSIPEYETQSFSPAYSYMFALAEQALKISPSLIKLQRERVKIDLELGYHVDIILIDKTTDEVIWALTTDPNKEATFYGTTSIAYDTSVIETWDSVKGIVQLNQNIVLDKYKILTTYIYESISFEYLDLNLNPFLNPDVKHNRIVFYVVPDVAGTGDNAVYYMFVQDNTVVYSNQGQGVAVPILTEFAEDGTTNEATIVGNDYISADDQSFSSRFPEYFVLAELNIGSYFNSANVQTIDCRVLGGNIRADSVEDAIRSNPKIAFTSGHAPAGGYQWPRAGSLLVKVPYTLHQNYGGELNNEQIRTFVTKHMNAGEYPIIKLDGVIPEWGNGDETQGVYGLVESINLIWNPEDPSYTFNVYYSRYIDGPWELLQNVSPGSGSNSLLVTGLTSGDIWYFYVTAVSDSLIESPPSIIQGAIVL